jgi:hypothetical protein
MDFTDNSRDPAATVLPFVQHDVTQPFPFFSYYGFCADMLEHIPTADVPDVLRNILKGTYYTFLQISTKPDQFGAVINQDLHLTVQPGDWWKEQIEAVGGVVAWSYESDLDVRLFVHS